MKKRNKIILCIVLGIIILGTIFGIVDYSRIRNGEKPLFMVKQYDKNGVQINYYGLGYKASGTLVYSTEYQISSVRFGLWFYSWEIEDTKKLDDNLINPNNSIQNVTLQEVKNIEKGMTYKDIIIKLGATKDEGSGVYSATYLVDNKDLLYISFANINDICDKSGEELYEQMIRFTLIDKAYDYLDNETKSKIVNLYGSNVTTLKIENNVYFYLNKDSEIVELKNMEIILVDFETDSKALPSNRIVILDADTKEGLGLGLVD